MSLEAINKLIARYHLDSIDNSQKAELAESILKRIVELNISPNPIHFTVIYESIQKIDPTLAKRIQDAIDTSYYSDDTANGFFNELIAKYLYQNLPTQQVETLLTNLLGEIEKWVDSAKQNETLVTKGFAQIETQLPESAKTTFEQEILPAINALLTGTNKLQNQAIEASSEIKQLKMELDQANTIAKTDELTGIANRRAFNEEFEEMLSNVKKEDTVFSLVIIDIDFFKNINDEYGHLIGDCVLRFLARLLTKETKGKDFVARMGGEEFVLLLPNTAYENALNLANNLRQKVASTKLQVTKQKKSLDLAISCGVATIKQDDTIETLLHRADTALYLAKNTGRNQVKGEQDIS